MTARLRWAIAGVVALWLGPGCKCSSGVMTTGSGLEVVRPVVRAGPNTWSMELGDLSVGTTARDTIQVRNRGKAPASLTSIQIRPGFERDVQLAPLTLPLVVEAFRTVEVGVIASASVEGRLESFVDVTTDDPDLSAFTVHVTAMGTTTPVVENGACELHAAPASLDFGQVPWSGFSEMVLVLSNRGTATCRVSAMELSGSSGFSLPSAPPLPLALAPSRTAEVRVRFKPAGGPGLESGTLAVKSNAQSSPLGVPLSANVVMPQACDVRIVPKPLAFGMVGVGTPARLDFEVWNFGIDRCPLVRARLQTGSNVDFSTSFVVAALAPGAKLTGKLTFVPSKTGMAFGTLLVEALPGFAPNVISSDTAPVTGEGAAAKLCVTPAALDFGGVSLGATRDLSFQVSNCGNAIAEVRAVVLDPGTAAAFSLQAVSPGQLLNPGASTAVTVRYQPTTAGAHGGSASVLSNVTAQPRVLLSGNHTSECGPQISCAPAAVRFASVAPGGSSLQSFECRNLSPSPVLIREVRRASGTPADFLVAAGTLPKQLASGESLNVSVEFRPVGVGQRSGTVEVVHDGCGGLHPVAVEGLAATGNLPACTHATTFMPVTKWAFASPSTMPAFDRVSALPVVINLTDDNGDSLVNEDDSPELVFSTYDTPNTLAGGMPQGAVLRAVRGSDGQEVWSVTDPALRVRWGTQPAAADLDGDGRPEVVAVLEHTLPRDLVTGHGSFVTGRLVCFSSQGRLVWLSDFWHRSALDEEDMSAPSIGDLDSDGHPEIVLGSSVFDYRGRLLWEGAGTTGSVGAMGPMSTLADLDDDGRLEIIAGGTVYRADGSIWWRYRTPAGQDVEAHAAVADFDVDGAAEVVLRTTVSDWVVLTANGTVKHSFSIPGQSTACAAPYTIADFDGDGRPELAAAFGDSMKMFEVDGTVRWSKPVVDFGAQCGAAGASAFDFDGDGAWEVVYNDTRHVYVYRGATGAVIYDAARHSETLYEIPVVADVDRDGHADLVVTNWNSPGLQVLSNVGNDWASAPPIWNQHTYHVTNIAPSGVVPRREGAGWRRFNAFRANRAGCQ